MYFLFTWENYLYYLCTIKNDEYLNTKCWINSYTIIQKNKTILLHSIKMHLIGIYCFRNTQCLLSFKSFRQFKIRTWLGTLHPVKQNWFTLPHTKYPENTGCSESANSYPWSFSFSKNYLFQFQSHIFTTSPYFSYGRRSEYLLSIQKVLEMVSYTLNAFPIISTQFHAIISAWVWSFSGTNEEGQWDYKNSFSCEGKGNNAYLVLPFICGSSVLGGHPFISLPGSPFPCKDPPWVSFSVKNVLASPGPHRPEALSGENVTKSIAWGFPQRSGHGGKPPGLPMSLDWPF